MKETQTTPVKTRPLREVLKEFDQAWVWGLGIQSWFLVFDPRAVEDNLLDCPAVGIPEIVGEPDVQTY